MEGGRERQKKETEKGRAHTTHTHTHTTHTHAQHTHREDNVGPNHDQGRGHLYGAPQSTLRPLVSTGLEWVGGGGEMEAPQQAPPSSSTLGLSRETESRIMATPSEDFAKEGWKLRIDGSKSLN